MAAYYGLCRIEDVDFVCTNGDYQNYNVLRRFLEGQVPYKDFANYLGMGVLYLCAPALAIHNTFAGSLFVTNFVACMAFMLFVAVVFYIVTENKYVSALMGILMPKLLSSKIILSVPVLGYYMDYYLGLLSAPMNSFRIVRLLLPVLFCVAILIVLSYLRKKEKKTTIRLMCSNCKTTAVMGFAVGMGLPWSNDFGVATIGSTTILIAILAIADSIQLKDKKAFRRFIWYFPAMVLGAILGIAIASRGHIGAWFEFTKGVASWQYTYYGEAIGRKLITVGEMFTGKACRRTRFHLLIYFVCMGWCLLKLFRRKENDRTILFVYLFTSIVAAHMLYMVGSGGDYFTEGTYDFVILTVYAIIVKAILLACKKTQKFSHVIQTSACVCCGLVALYIGWKDLQINQQYQNSADEISDYYVPELEGINSNGVALKEMQSIVKEEALFATFSTALDDMRGTFQPTGIDYVIHALGDNQYADYVSNLKNNDYKWVQTTNVDVWPWEKWICRASWDLYKTIFSDYTLHSDHSFWTLWEYTEEDAWLEDVNVKLISQQNADGSCTLSVYSDEQDGYWLDVKISWKMEKGDKAPWLLRATVFVEDANLCEKTDNFDGYFIPKQGERNIPIYMEKGSGSVKLQCPEGYSVSVSAQIQSVIKSQK